jgi:regulatory protein
MSRRRVSPVTPAGLEKSALAYLERFACSTEQLRRVLNRRIERAARAGLNDREEAKEWVAPLIAKLATRRLLNDRLYAEGRARSLSRQGKPRGAIARTLQVKGVGKEDIAAALGGLEEDGETDLAAAVRLARRKRLGPFRPAKDRKDRRDRDMAALGRAGYSFEIARKVVDAESVEALEEDDGS